METCQCDQNSQDADPGLWFGGGNVQMGVFTVVGYLLYRFSQTLPALIRWPIRLFCSLTGLSALWGWVSHIVGTLRGIQSLCKWLSRIWHFVEGLTSRFKWLASVITGSSDAAGPGSSEPLRLILLGPAGGGRTSLADSLLSVRETSQPSDPLLESVRRRAVTEGREVTVIDTPDLLGSSLGNSWRAREALRSLQLCSPGPHALLLVVPAPNSGKGLDQDVAQAMRATLELFGDEASGHIIPVFTHADHLGRRRTAELKKTALPPACTQEAELVDNSSEEAQAEIRRRLLGRVMEVKTLRGHFAHEMQRREERVREELLEDMASELAGKLGHM